MAGFVLKRMALLPVTLLLVITITFVTVRLLPANPAQLALGDQATTSAVHRLEHEMGLDKPLATQYFTYLGNVLHGNLGTSLSTHLPVTQEILKLAPYTLLLALFGAFFGVLFGVPAGVISAARHNSALDQVLRLATLAGIGMPIFYLGLLLIWLFGVRLGWFPVVGTGHFSNPASLLRHLVLPGAVVGFNVAPMVVRVTRSSMLEVIHQDYVRTARAKGLGSFATLGRHALRNAMLPVITIISLQMGNLLGGSIITEAVFSRRGLGDLLISSVLNSDYPQIEGGVIFFALAFAMVNLLADVLYMVADPRVRATVR